jgi:hypothetical protein
MLARPSYWLTIYLLLYINSRLAFYYAFAYSRSKQVSRTSKCPAQASVPHKQVSRLEYPRTSIYIAYN